MNLADFGSSAMPLRASHLPLLAICPRSVVAKMTEENESGPAADTGSAVHKAAHLWHTEARKDAAVAVKVMRELITLYPLADLDAAAEQFLYYARDTRNESATVLLAEEKIIFAFPPCEGDTTQKEIVITGTLDQLREVDGELILCDLKTGSADGGTMLNDYAFQLAAYMIGASQKVHRKVNRACVIRTKDYGARKNGPVFWYAPYTYNDAVAMMQQVAAEVARIRRSEMRIAPGRHCSWCIHGGPQNCLRA